MSKELRERVRERLEEIVDPVVASEVAFAATRVLEELDELAETLQDLKRADNLNDIREAARSVIFSLELIEGYTRGAVESWYGWNDG